jgi:hypothetical protein
MPPWFGPPRGTLPGVVALERIVAQTPTVAVCIARIAAYPTGFEFDFLTMTTGGQPATDPMMFHHHRQQQGAGNDVAPEILRLGVQFADGSKVTNLDRYDDESNPPARPVMHPCGGGGGDGSWRQTQWVWPLPPPGPVAFVCEWPAMDIALTRSEVDAQSILDAAARAQVIFSDEQLPEPPDEGDGTAPTTFGR